jgi:hypothetical protein
MGMENKGREIHEIHGTISKAVLLVYYFNPFTLRMDNRFWCSKVICR